MENKHFELVHSDSELQQKTQISLIPLDIPCLGAVNFNCGFISSDLCGCRVVLQSISDQNIHPISFGPVLLRCFLEVSWGFPGEVTF